MKICKNCKEEKNLKEFYTVVVKGKTYPKSRCKQCQVKYENERRKDPQIRGRYIKVIRTWLYKNKDNPIQIKKIKAREKVRGQVISGKIKKQSCLDCNSIETFAHHPNYNKPLEIVWLCRLHHAIEHKKIKSFPARVAQQ